MRLRVGLSTCPNDTFAFHGILERRVDMRGLEVEAELLDVQRLNDGLFADRYDVSKASFHAALLLADRYDVLGSGAALGFGVGPLLVSARPDVIWPYVELYVNDHTVELGAEGARALGVLEQTARDAGVIPAGLPPLRVVA